MLAGAGLAGVGLIHGWAWGVGDTVLVMRPGVAMDATYGYLAAAAILFVAPWLGERSGVAHE
jgi:hypothetical protein